MKVCSKCGVEKELTEFGRHSYAKDGLRCCCRKCSNAAIKQYKRDNADKINAQRRLARAASPEKDNASCRRYYRNHREELIEYHRSYYKNNTEKKKALSAKWRRENRGRVAENNLKYQASKKAMKSMGYAMDLEEWANNSK